MLGSILPLAETRREGNGIPLHFEGWAHFSEGREQIAAAFAAAGLSERLRWPDSGRSIDIGI